MIVNSSNKNFKDHWDCLYSRTNNISPLYSRKCQDFYAQRPYDEGKTIIDKSFILLWENEPVIAFLGATIETNGKVDLLAYEIPCISIENRNDLTKKAIRTFLNEFEIINEKINGSFIYRDFLIDGQLSSLSGYLLRQGANIHPVISQVIDLSKDETVLKRNIRKSYGSLINWGLREMQLKILDSTNITLVDINIFRELHIREAGKETRSKKSWAKQLELVQAEEAFVVFGKIDNEIISAGFFMYNRTICSYGISVSRRDMFEKPMSHALMWTAIIHAKYIGCNWFDIGDISFPNHSHETNYIPTKKDLGIGVFKSGFGGQNVCQLLINQKKLDKN